MSKTIKRLEKDNSELKKKNEKSDLTLIEMFDEVKKLVFPPLFLLYPCKYGPL